MTPVLRSRTALLLALTVLAGCSALQPEKETEETAERIPFKAPLPIRKTENMVGDLLIAEMAAQRDALQVTLEYYSRVGLESNDPRVLEQAARLAAYLREHDQALKLAERWLRQEPDDSRAREIAALAAISLGQPAQAALHIDRLMARDPDTALNDLVSQARQLDPGSNEPLLAAFSSLVEQYPEQAPLWYARALYRQRQGETEEALHACEQALERAPDHRQALLLKANLLSELGRGKEARKHLAELIQRFPESAQVRVRYARELINAGELSRARKEVRAIAERFPDSPELRVSLALHALEQDHLDTAREIFQQLLDEGYRSDDVHLYLARVASENDEPDRAIRHYLQVSGGENRLRARVQAARLMYLHGRGAEAGELLEQLREQHPDQAPSLYASQAEMLRRADRTSEAMTLLNNAIGQLPNERELLYARAMISEKLGRTGQAEADLRRVLEIKPGDAVALNALGYTLADHNQRLTEARGYIERALEKQPENPAFLDSMGWVLYRQGKPEKALDWLRRAWEKMKDPEVAAHYGEVLWQLGQQDKAREIWRLGEEENPDNLDVIRETRERLTGEAS